jgi:hypothetical protein
VDFTASFWGSFWSGLVSGLVSGLFVSVLVGWWFFKKQTAFEASQVRATVERDVGVLKARLSQALARRNPFVHDYRTAILAERLWVAEAGSLLLGMPIHQWRPTLPDEAKFFDACDAFLGAHSHFVRVATEYDAVIDEVIGDAPEILQCPAVWVHAFLVASSMEKGNDRLILVAAGAPASMSEKVLRSDANLVRVDARVEGQKRVFENAKQDLNGAESRLRAVLAVP